MSFITHALGLVPKLPAPPPVPAAPLPSAVPGAQAAAAASAVNQGTGYNSRTLMTSGLGTAESSQNLATKTLLGS